LEFSFAGTIFQSIMINCNCIQSLCHWLVTSAALVKKYSVLQKKKYLEQGNNKDLSDRNLKPTAYFQNDMEIGYP